MTPFKHLIEQIEQEQHVSSILPIKRLQRIVELIHAHYPRHQWTGIYLLKDNYLELGPFVGAATEHRRIAIGQGLCGQAVAQKQDLDIADVLSAPGYLACSLSTRAEAIVLIYHQHCIVGQIDVDSDTPGKFGNDYMQELKIIADTISALVAECSKK